MSRKDDLEKHIREANTLISKYEQALRESSDPQERARFRSRIADQRDLLRDWLQQYIRLCHGTGYLMQPDITELAISMGIAVQPRETTHKPASQPREQPRPTPQPREQPRTEYKPAPSPREQPNLAPDRPAIAHQQKEDGKIGGGIGVVIGALTGVVIGGSIGAVISLFIGGDISFVIGVVIGGGIGAVIGGNIGVPIGLVSFLGWVIGWVIGVVNGGIIGGIIGVVIGGIIGVVIGEAITRSKPPQ